MKKIVVAAIVGIAVLAVVGVIVMRSISARGMPGAGLISEISPKAAESLQAKIDAIKKANENPERPHRASHVEVSEAELESYVLYSLKDDIPVQLDSIDVQLRPGTVAADTQLTFTSNSTGNPMVDTLVGGTHNLFLKGNLIGEQRRGKFELDEIRVDGIPVPKILIQTLFDKYVKPNYPQADLKEPFDLPWGIEQLKLEQGKATVVY
jgi:hypothetical protein